jgi:hypothetical protein
MAELTNQIIVLSVRSDAEQIRRCESLVSKLRQGFLVQSRSLLVTAAPTKFRFVRSESGELRNPHRRVGSTVTLLQSSSQLAKETICGGRR